MHQVIIDLDESFKKLSTPPLIANDFNLWTEEGKKSFLSMHKSLFAIHSNSI